MKRSNGDYSMVYCWLMASSLENKSLPKGRSKEAGKLGTGIVNEEAE